MVPFTGEINQKSDINLPRTQDSPVSTNSPYMYNTFLIVVHVSWLSFKIISRIWVVIVRRNAIPWLGPLISTDRHTVHTHCLESQAECSNANSGQPTFSLNKSTCFLNCEMASNGADAWKLRRQICIEELSENRTSLALVTFNFVLLQ